MAERTEHISSIIDSREGSAVFNVADVLPSAANIENDNTPHFASYLENARNEIASKSEQDLSAVLTKDLEALKGGVKVLLTAEAIHSDNNLETSLRRAFKDLNLSSLSALKNGERVCNRGSLIQATIATTFSWLPFAFTSGSMPLKAFIAGSMLLAGVTKIFDSFVSGDFAKNAYDAIKGKSLRIAENSKAEFPENLEAEDIINALGKIDEIKKSQNDRDDTKYLDRELKLQRSKLEQEIYSTETKLKIESDKKLDTLCSKAEAVTQTFDDIEKIAKENDLQVTPGMPSPLCAYIVKKQRNGNLTEAEKLGVKELLIRWSKMTNDQAQLIQTYPYFFSISVLKPQGKEIAKKESVAVASLPGQVREAYISTVLESEIYQS